ncbi:hypothetical protein C8R46DRAFT_366968 [Mycena filopes]|nr:hypothetical protein C8R46DRAFT_366968 [Mycena filopes]
MSLVDLPEDILLELCRRLVVSDLVNLLSTCRVMRNLQLQRTLWLDALTRIRTVEMYPLPPINPSDLSLPHLQQIARRASRLILNFESEKPLPVDIHTVAVGYGDEFIAIPGTHLVVVVEGLGIVSCWDVHTSRRVAYLELPGLRAQTGAPCMESEGKALIGACIG